MREEEYYNLVLDLDTSNQKQEKYFRIIKDDDEYGILISAYAAAKILYNLYHYGINALSDMIDSNEI